MRRLLCSALLALLFGCGSSGGGVRIVTIEDGGGNTGADAAGGKQDLAGMPPQDLATNGPVDLAMNGPVDLATPVDLTTPPDLTSIVGACAAGRYAGPLMVNAGGMFALTGTVALTLGPSVNGVLPITVGTMTAAMGMTITASADVIGNLDCGNKKLAGTLKNGMVTAFGMMMPFAGMISADYVSQNRTFTNGLLSIDLLAGMGTWTANYLGP